MLNSVSEGAKFMRIKAVIFDLDGTISCFNLDYSAARAEVRSFLISRGVPAVLLSLDESIFRMLRKAELFLKVRKPRKSFDEIRNQALAITEKFELDAAMRTTLLPGILETLEALKQMGLKVGLFTINSEKSVNCILKRLEIDALFDVTVSRDKVKHVKPHPEHLKVALKALGTSAKHTLVVGDGAVDMQSAKDVKAIAVGLSTGFSTAEHLKQSGANYIITSASDLPSLIYRINRLVDENGC